PCGANCHCSAAFIAFCAKYWLEPMVLNLAATTLPAGLTSTCTVTLIVPWTVFLALLGMSGMTRCVTCPLAAGILRAGAAGVVFGCLDGPAGPAEGLLSTTAGAAVSGFEGSALFPREWMSAKMTIMATTAPPSAIIGVRLRLDAIIEGAGETATGDTGVAFVGAGVGLFTGVTGAAPGCSFVCTCCRVARRLGSSCKQSRAMLRYGSAIVSGKLCLPGAACSASATFCVMAATRVTPSDQTSLAGDKTP